VTARLTPAEARALGIDVPAAKKKRTTKHTGGGKYHTKCKTCDEEFTTAAAEDRHVHDAHHVRYELIP